MDILKGHKSKIFAAVFIAIIGVGFGVIPYFSVAAIINNLVAKNTNLNNYYPYIFAVFLGFLASILFHEISTIISHNLAYRIIEDKRKLLADKLSKISMGEVERKSSGQWSQFMVETLDKMEKPIAHVIPEVIANIFIPIVLIITIFIMDWRIGIANLLTIPLGLLFSMLMMRGYEEKSKRYQEAAKAMNTTMVEYVNGIKVIKAFNKSASSFGKFRKTVEENKNAMLDWYLSVCFSMTATMETIPSTMVIPNLKRGEEVRDIKSYDVEFKDVTFAYEESKNVLNNISFKANENELTAIVGNSGSGKSTITKLIAGFWNVSNGEILIGKTNLNELPLKQNMELVSYVSQENFLFNKTILENLKMAKEDASMDEIKEACEKASCYNFIKSLPNGYETIVGKGGANLSGGEKQRIAIARCFLKNSPIVLLDEATAYSDPDNESVIQQSIDKLIKDKTVIMVAHRLSTIVNANKIIVVDNGEVIEEGTHKQLLELNGRYKKMWDVYTESKEIEVI